MPKDYVNYVKITWADSAGIERVVYPAIRTSNPYPIIQDNDFNYTFDSAGEVIAANESETQKRFQTTNRNTQADNSNIDNLDLINNGNWGRRYGLTPAQAQSNGVFYIDPLKGIIFFDSSFANKIVTLKYISDGLDSDDMTVHKFAEEAIYKYIAHAVLATRANTPEYLVMRFKKEVRAAKRNAKLRLSNIKIEEIAQVMRNKSKIIKH